MGKDIYVVVGKRIRQERQRARLTIEKLAEHAGISPSFLAYIETQGRKASLKTIQNIADALRLPPSELLKDVEERADKGFDRASRQFALLVRDKSEPETDAILNLVRTVSRKMPTTRRPPR